MSTASAKKPQEHTEKIIECDVHVELTDDQLAQVADDLADKTIEKLRVQQEAKDAGAGYRKVVKDLRKDIKRLAEERQARAATVSMQCVEVYEYPNRVAVYRSDKDRTDPKALVSERALTKDELHQPMFTESELKGPANDDASGTGTGNGAPEAAKSKTGRKTTKKPGTGASISH